MENERARALLAIQMAAMPSHPSEPGPSHIAPLLDVFVDTVRFPTPMCGGIRAVTVASDGSQFVCSQTGVHIITSSGARLIAGSLDEEGMADGAGPDARFRSPRGITCASNGCLLVADTWNHCIRKITPRPGAKFWTVSTLAGCGEAGFADGLGPTALFNGPYGIAVHRDGDIFVADLYNNCIRRITPEGCVSTHAGSTAAGYFDGPADVAKFSWPHGLCFDMQWRLLVCDLRNHCIRRITERTVHTDEGRNELHVATETFAGGAAGQDEEEARGEQEGGCADGAAAVACFNNPVGVVVDSNGSVFITDRGNRRVRMVVETAGPARSVMTLAGGVELGKKDGWGRVACFDDPRALAIDPCGRLLITEDRNMALDGYWAGGQLGLLRRVHTLLPWHLARVLYIGLLKERPPPLRADDRVQAGAGGGERQSEGLTGRRGCFLALLPLDAAGSCSSSILRLILVLAWKPVSAVRR